MDNNSVDYKQITKEFYNEKFRSDNILKLDNSESYRLSIIIGLIQSLRLPEPSKIKILDFGCGRGWLSYHLSKYGKVTGIDLSDESINQAKKEFPNIEFYCLDAHRIDEELGNLGMFDIVVSSEVIEHVLDQVKYVLNIERLLKEKSGFLILTTPNGRFKKNYFYGERAKWGQPLELWLNEAKLRGLLKPYFKKIQIRSFDSTWIVKLQTFGIAGILGNRMIYRFLNRIKLSNLYIKLLERLDFGLYLVAFCKR